MNQILVTEKLYITPELKRKKKIYKFDFIISLFLVIILISLYIYAEYDRNKSAEASQAILAEMEDNTIAKDDTLLVVLDGTSEDIANMSVAEANQNAETNVNPAGYKYKTVATINIPKINVNYPVLQGETGTTEEVESLLKMAPCKYWGGDPNEVGNFCIVGHNYKRDIFFSKVPRLVVGDTIRLTDLTGRTLTYVVYDKYTVDPTDTSCTTQLTGGKKEVTLITCTDDTKQRVVVKTKEVK